MIPEDSQSMSKKVPMSPSHLSAPFLVDNNHSRIADGLMNLAPLAVEVA
jgi:hypothetical protein